MYPENLLKHVFDRTDGRCHICGFGLRFEMYGKGRSRYGWEVDHSVPRALGGSESLRNLLPAHGACNRVKGTRSSHAARRTFGLEKRPLSKAEQGRVRMQRAWFGGVLGTLLFATFGRKAVFLGAVGGAALGYGVDPE